MFFYLPKWPIGKVSGEEAAHFFSLRVEVGDEVWVTSFEGRLAKIKLAEVQRKTKVINFQILETQNQPRALASQILLQAIPSKEYLEKFFEVIGLTRIETIYLFFSDFSLEYKLNLERLNKILVRSLELGERAWKPEIKFLESKSEFYSLCQATRPKVLHTLANPNSNLEDNPDSSGSSKFLVGPEGGWSKQELGKFQNLNLDFVNLGSIVYPAWLGGFVYSARLVKLTTVKK